MGFLLYNLEGIGVLETLQQKPVSSHCKTSGDGKTIKRQCIGDPETLNDCKNPCASLHHLIELLSMQNIEV